MLLLPASRTGTSVAMTQQITFRHMGRATWMGAMLVSLQGLSACSADWEQDPDTDTTTTETTTETTAETGNTTETGSSTEDTTTETGTTTGPDTSDEGTTGEGGATSGDTSGSCQDCDPDACDCVGTKRCLDGNTPQECGDEYSWESLPDCGGDTPVCLAETGECGCVEDEIRCSGASTRERCVSGTWVSISECSGSTPACVAAGECVACTEGQPNRCSPDQTSIQACSEYGWITKQACNTFEGGVCEDGACTSAAISPDFIACGNSYCETGAEVCCSNDPGASFCAASAADCPAQECNASAPDEVTINCDGPSDCSDGEFCCLSRRFDDTCGGVFPDAMHHIETFCASDCLGTIYSGDYSEFEVCTGPAGCSLSSVVPCTLQTVGQEQMYTCDVFSWTYGY